MQNVCAEVNQEFSFIILYAADPLANAAFYARAWKRLSAGACESTLSIAAFNPRDFT